MALQPVSGKAVVGSVSATHDIRRPAQCAQNAFI
jgi:hypothetical protein